MRSLVLTILASVLSCSPTLAQTTYELMEQADAAFQRADAELNAAYKEVMADLSAEQKEALKLAQRAWIDYRDACVKSEGAVYAGGTLSGVAAGNAKAALTAEQARLLKDLSVSSVAEVGSVSERLQAADAALNEVYQVCVARHEEDDVPLREAQRAWLKYRDLFAKAAASIVVASDSAAVEKATLAELTELRTERLKGLFAEGWPPDSASVKADDYTDEDSLCGAIARGDLVAVRDSLAAGVDWEAACPEGLDLPLHVAVGTGNVELVALLLENGAPLEQKDNYLGGTPLMHAAEAGDAKMIEFFISQGADPNAADDESFTVVDSAAGAGHWEAVALLQAKGGRFGRLPAVPADPAPQAQAAPAPQTHQGSAVPPGAPTTAGRPVIKGFVMGMPFRDAVARMHELKLTASEHLRPDGSLDWDKLLRKDDYGNRYVEGAQGYLLIWKLVPDDEDRLASMYLQGAVSAHLFNAKDLDGQEFAQAFVEGYGIDRMEAFEAPTDLVARVTGGPDTQIGWQKVDRRNGWRLAVHEDKAIIYETITKASETAFD